MSSGSRTVLVLAAMAGAGCATADIPQAHRGQIFEKTGFAFLFGRQGIHRRDPGAGHLPDRALQGHPPHRLLDGG